jgi:hypothetical protein
MLLMDRRVISAAEDGHYVVGEIAWPQAVEHVAVVLRSLSVLSKPLMRDGERVRFPLLDRSCGSPRQMLSARLSMQEVDERGAQL